MSIVINIQGELDSDSFRPVFSKLSLEGKTSYVIKLSKQILYLVIFHYHLLSSGEYHQMGLLLGPSIHIAIHNTIDTADYLFMVMVNQCIYFNFISLYFPNISK